MVRMSPTPDYFITSCGRSKLNREKFKLYQNETKKPEWCKNETNPTQQPQKKLFVAQVPYSDNKKLLSNRESVKTVVVAISHPRNNNNRRGKLLVCDKDIKCAINQKIKISQESSRKHEISNSNETLDNRLTYQRKYSNEIFGHNQTDLIVLPPLDF